MSQGRGRGICLVTLAAWIAGCEEGTPPAPPPPSATIDAVFSLAQEEEPAADRLAHLFEPTALSRARASLLDALGKVPTVRSLGRVSIHELEGPEDLAAEIEADLGSGGTALFRMRLAPSAEGWRVRWLSGPALEWPPPEKRTGDGLSSSEPPATSHG